MLKSVYTGNYLGEFPVDFNVDSLIEVDIVSIIFDGNGIEVALNFNDYLYKYNTELDAISLVNVLLNDADINKVIVFSGRREIMVYDKKVSQYLIALNKGSVSKDKIEGVII